MAINPRSRRLGRAVISVASASSACSRMPDFALFVTNVYLNQYIKRRKMRRALLAELRGDFQTIDGVAPVKVFRHQTTFVGLQRPDKVPL